MKTKHVLAAFVAVPVLFWIAGKLDKLIETPRPQTYSSQNVSTDSNDDQVASRATTADAFASIYRNNAVAGDQAYKGQRFIVIGTVESVGTTVSTGLPYVEMSGGDSLPPRFELTSSQTGYAARLSKGDIISLVCTGRGNIANIPISDSCVEKKD